MASGNEPVSTAGGSTRQGRWQRWGLRAIVVALVVLVAFWFARGPLARVAADYGLSRVQVQQLASAERWMTVAATLAPADPRVLFDQARFHRKLGELDVATRLLQAAHQSGYSYPLIQIELLLIDAQGGAILPLQRRLSTLLTSSQEPREVCEAYVIGCLMAYRLPEALAVLEVWSRDFPNDPQPYFLRGRIAEHRADYGTAVTAHQKALAVCPDHAGAAYNLGRLLLQQQKIDDAIAAYRTAASVGYSPQPGRVGEADALIEARRYDEAGTALAAAEAANPARLTRGWRQVGVPAATARGFLYEVAGKLAQAKEQHADAAAWYRKALAVDPSDWRTRYQLAQALRKTNDPAAAEVELKHVERTRAALADYDKAMGVLAEDPGNLDARFTVARVLLEHLSKDQGIVWLRRLLELAPGHAAAQALLAEHEPPPAGPSPPVVP